MLHALVLLGTMLVTESVFKLFLKNLVSKGLFAACIVAMATVGILHKPL